MMEIGPFKVDGQGGLKIVEGGWEEYTTMVYGAGRTPLLLFTRVSHFDSRSTCGDGIVVH